MNTPDNQPGSKVGWLVGAILLTVSVSGYFMGLRQTSSQISLSRPVSPEPAPAPGAAVPGTHRAPVAVSYALQDWLREGPNGEWRGHLSQLAQPPSAPPAPTAADAADRLRALEERAARRSFEGAPPTIPHPITQDSSAACLACHGPGLVVGERVASKISHPHLSNCTQCHVPSASSHFPVAIPALLSAPAPNEFLPAPPVAHGRRAFPQAPPTIPHPTHMRGDCLSCHGPRGLFALRTSHPERQSCAQCHVADALLDQHSFALETP